jgi:phage tail sheath gpL-like
MGIDSNSLAVGVGVELKNAQFQSAAQVVPRKQVIVGTFDAAKTAVIPDEPILVTSPEDAGDKFGFGSMLHRLIKSNWLGSKGKIPTYCIAQEDESDAVKAAGSIVFTAAGLLAGTVAMFIGGDKVKFNVTAGMTSAQVATAAYNAINAIKELPVVATNGTPGTTDIVAKMYGTYGNSIKISFNLDSGDVIPVGLTYNITQLTGGVGVPDIQTALDALGTGDDANEANFTDFIHGYGNDTTTLDAIRDYVGAGNLAQGTYDNLVSRPFRSQTADVAIGSSGLAALVILGNGRKSDRAQGTIGVPGSPNHPAEIAAQVIGHAARVNNSVAQQDCAWILLEGVYPGAKADRWTSDSDNRELAIKSGISTTRVLNDEVYIQNLITFYHPDNVPVDSNGWRAFAHISVTQNIAYNWRLNFSQEKWQGTYNVANTMAVSNPTARAKARDANSVLDDIVNLVTSFEKMGWIYSKKYTIDQLKVPGTVTARTGNLGWDAKVKLIYCGIGWIINTEVQFDTSIAVLN